MTCKRCNSDSVTVETLPAADTKGIVNISTCADCGYVHSAYDRVRPKPTGRGQKSEMGARGALRVTGAKDSEFSKAMGWT